MDKVTISKTISYWLRHNPEDQNLNMDSEGWVDLDKVITVLNQNITEISLNEIIEIDNSSDKKRWEIDLSNNKIRATHGHSVNIELTNFQIPPEKLYHGTKIENIKSILSSGIEKRERQFVHLSQNIEAAYQVALRYGKPIIFRIDTDEMIKKGYKFILSNDNVWLTENIPNWAIGIEPWFQINSDEHKNNLQKELKSEVNNRNHVLYKHLNDLRPIWKRCDCDDFLFFDSKNKNYYVVHLTWNKEKSSEWPSTIKYNTFDDVIRDCFIVEQNEWFEINATSHNTR